MPGGRSEVSLAVAAVFREEAGHVVSSLARRVADFSIAEESVQEALLAAIEHWPKQAIPRRPGAWLLTVARRVALNRLARDSRYATKLRELAELDDLPHEPDDRLRLIFTCCHPALARDAQVALTLRAVCGFTTRELAHAFLAKEATVAQRIARAQRKIADAAIRYKMPDDDELSERIGEVLAVLYLMFNEGYLSSGGAEPSRRNLAQDAAWLAALLAQLMPEDPEALGLLALMELHLARTDARFDQNGELIVLSHQDRTRWNRELISEAVSHLERAGAMRRVGPYQIEAAIAACHAEAESFQATDWVQILLLYDLLLTITASPVVALNRAVALRHVQGPEAALAEVAKLEGALGAYHLFHAIRGELWIELGQADLARAARAQALNLTENCAEQALLRRRLFT